MCRPLDSLEEKPRPPQQQTANLTSRKSKGARTLVEPQEEQPFPNCKYGVLKSIWDYYVWVFFPSGRYFPGFPFQSHFLCNVKYFLSFDISPPFPFWFHVKYFPSLLSLKEKCTSLPILCESACFNYLTMCTKHDYQLLPKLTMWFSNNKSIVSENFFEQISTFWFLI